MAREGQKNQDDAVTLVEKADLESDLRVSAFLDLRWTRKTGPLEMLN